MATSRSRVRLLDILRGLSLVSMIVWHVLFDLVYIFHVSLPWFHEMPSFIWEQLTCSCFVLVSGASLHYGRRTFRRAATVLCCALLISLVTYFALPDMLIVFGILHMLGCCMAVAAFTRPHLAKIPRSAGVICCAALFMVLYLVPRGALGLLGFPLASVPPELYTTDYLFFLGLPGPTFYSGDYFPLIPWLFLFFAGFFGFAFLKGLKALAATTAHNNPIEWLGRHSLPVYLIHQPAILGILLLLQFIGVL